MVVNSEPPVAVTIRPATAADAWTIRRIVWQARINPTGLNWRRFLVAEEAGRVVGVAQVKPHAGGSRELASLAVVPERQGAGTGSALIRALLGREGRPLYLSCRRELVSYYARFGFREVGWPELPPGLARRHRLANMALRPLGWLRGEPAAIAAMRLDNEGRTPD
jgi:amino-acid N-acetyltransferase